MFNDAQAAEPEVVEVSQERINERRGQSIVRMIEELQLEVADLNVTVDGEIAVLEGQVKDQEACEKITLAAGNQYGISQVDCRLTVDSPADEARFYTVVSGDTLSGIAKEFYGNAGKYMVIFKANGPMLKDPNKIYPGQVLRIPAGD